MVAGQYPTRQWKDNPDCQIRTVAEAVEIAKKYGVVIPDDVEFHLDESEELNCDITARGPRVDKPMGERVYWTDLVHDRTQKVPFRIWPDILKSDEAIVAVISHEMHEILCCGHTSRAAKYRLKITSGTPNLEDQEICMTRHGMSPTVSLI